MKDKINVLQFCSLMFQVLLSPFLGMGVYNILKIAKVDSTISCIFGLIFSIIIILIYKGINDYKPELNLKEKIETLFKKKSSFIIISILSISFFLLSLSLSYNINSFIVSQFLSETPIIFLGIIFSLLIFYINKKGIEVISRVATILTFLTIILILVASFGKYSQVDLSNLNPILTSGIKNPIIGGIYFLLIHTTYVFLLLIIPKKNYGGKVYKYMFITMISIYLIFLVIIIYTIAVLGIDLALLYHYPAYIIMKEITLFGFIDKIENFIIIHWIFEVFICLSLITHFIYKMSGIKPIITITLNLIIYTLLFKNSTLFNYIVTYSIPFITIIYITILAIYIKIKRV